MVAKVNGKVVASITPTDYAIHEGKATFTAVAGLNEISFEGAGASDKVGMTIDNVELLVAGPALAVEPSMVSLAAATQAFNVADSEGNFVVNGGFEEPPQNGGWAHVENGKVPHWTA